MKSIQELSPAELKKEADSGSRFIAFTYVVSLFFVSYRNRSATYVIRKGEKPFQKGFRFSIISLLFGWWAIPFGPKYTIESIRNNIKGELDITDEIAASAAGFLLYEEVEVANAAQSKKNLLRKVS